MGLDIPIPLGLIFLITGGMMAVYGIVTHANAELYEKSMGVNLNMTWGIVMVAFGLVMFVLGRRAKRM